MTEHDCTKCLHAHKLEDHVWKCDAIEYDIKDFGCYVPKMTFGDAIEALKKGAKLARRGWNGKGMFLYYVPANAYPPSTDVAKEAFGGENVPYSAYIAMKTAQDNVVPWLASQTDMLSEDWYIVE
jgi:hypothetical protein